MSRATVTRALPDSRWPWHAEVRADGHHYAAECHATHAEAIDWALATVTEARLTQLDGASASIDADGHDPAHPWVALTFDAHGSLIDSSDHDTRTDAVRHAYDVVTEELRSCPRP